MLLDGHKLMTLAFPTVMRVFLHHILLRFSLYKRLHRKTPIPQFQQRQDSSGKKAVALS